MIRRKIKKNKDNIDDDNKKKIANPTTTTPAAVAAATDRTVSNCVPSEAFDMASGVLYSCPGPDHERRDSLGKDCSLTNPIANPSRESLTPSPVSTTRGYLSGNATVAPAEPLNERSLMSTLQGIIHYTRDT